MSPVEGKEEEEEPRDPGQPPTSDPDHTNGGNLKQNDNHDKDSTSNEVDDTHISDDDSKDEEKGEDKSAPSRTSPSLMRTPAGPASFSWLEQLCEIVKKGLAALEMWVTLDMLPVNICKALALLIWFIYLVSAPTVNTKDNCGGCESGQEVFDYYERAQQSLPWQVFFVYSAAIVSHMLPLWSGRYLPGDVVGSVLYFAEIILSLMTLRRGDMDFVVASSQGENVAHGLARMAFVYYSITLGLVDTLLTFFVASLSASCDATARGQFSESRAGQAWFISGNKYFKGPFALVMIALLLFVFARAVQTFRNEFVPPIIVITICLLAAFGLLLHSLQNYGNENIGLGAAWKVFAIPGLGLAYLWIDIREHQTTPALLVTATIVKSVVEFAVELITVP